MSLMNEMQNCSKLSKYSADSVLSLMESSANRKSKPELVDAFRMATEETEKDIILTVSLEKVVVHKDHDWGSGEIYVIGSLLDGSTETKKDYKAPIFQGINDGDELPLGSGGMLIGCCKNPGAFIDIHGIVMESDSDIRNFGSLIEEAKTNSNFSEVEKIITSLSTFDPTKLSAIMTGVNIFLDVLVGILKANMDDHISTFHDFYLRQQGYGIGRHPETGLLRSRDASLAYKIDVVDF